MTLEYANDLSNNKPHKESQTVYQSNLAKGPDKEDCAVETEHRNLNSGDCAVKEKFAHIYCLPFYHQPRIELRKVDPRNLIKAEIQGVVNSICRNMGIPVSILHLAWDPSSTIPTRTCSFPHYH